MISDIPRELYDITKGYDVHQLLIQIISDVLDSSYSRRLNDNDMKSVNNKRINLLDVVILKRGEWISDIGGKYHEDCYKISYSYNFRYYYHTITESNILGWIRDSKINQLLGN
jgi:hypothetical protein